MFDVYVGSTNPVKIAAVKSVMKEANVIGLEGKSGVSNQPFNDEETLQGAINRAKSLPSDGIRIGLEAGIAELNGRWYLINWGALIDQEGKLYTAGGTRIPLPLPIQSALLQRDKELAQIMDEVYHTQQIKHKEGAIGLFTANRVKRVDIFIHIVQLLIGQVQAKNHH